MDRVHGPVERVGGPIEGQVQPLERVEGPIEGVRQADELREGAMTRKARGTLGKRQKQKIHGTVPAPTPPKTGA